MSKIEDLLDRGDKQVDYSNFNKAMKYYEQALAELPSPKAEQEYYLEIHVAIGDVLISQGKNGEAMKLYTKIMKHPNADEYALLHLRMGQVAHYNGKMELAKTELKRALELGGKELFDDEYEIYYECATDQDIEE